MKPKIFGIQPASISKEYFHTSISDGKDKKKHLHYFSKILRDTCVSSYIWATRTLLILYFAA